VSLPFFTIGHSTRTIDAFLDLLREAGIALLIDIRTIPKSRTNPQFNKDALPDALAPFGIGYEHVAALGGLRRKAREVPQHVNDYWKNESFRNYADYALTEPFQAGLEHLRAEGHRRRCAIMCSEAVWWRCHRRIVADYLMANGETVMHIMGPGRLEQARLTPGAIVRPDKTIIYPIPGDLNA
jgi:uncharacterized protein (DUF488 family)